jgi:molybdopterin converting factor small subunit
MVSKRSDRASRAKNQRELNKNTEAEINPRSTNQRAVNQLKNEYRTSKKDPRAKNQRALNRENDKHKRSNMKPPQ